MEAFQLPVEIKCEPPDEPEPDDTSNLVCIKSEPDLDNGFEDCELKIEQPTILIFEPAMPNVQEPLNQVDPESKQKSNLYPEKPRLRVARNLQNRKQTKGYSKKTPFDKEAPPITDLSIFWKPFQEQNLSEASQVLLSKHDFGKNFLSNICQGQADLNMNKGWKVYCIKEDNDFKLLLSEMYVEKGRPVMHRQIVINTMLGIMLYYGSRRIRNVDLEGTKIRSTDAIKQLVDDFSSWKMCPGLTEEFDFNYWSHTIKLDATMNKYRHSQCPILHKYAFSECIHCKFLQVRVKRTKLKRNRNFMTSSMLLNYTYWTKMRMKIRNLKICNRRMRKEKLQLKRKLRKLHKAAKSKILSDTTTQNHVQNVDESFERDDYNIQSTSSNNNLTPGAKVDYIKPISAVLDVAGDVNSSKV